MKIKSYMNDLSKKMGPRTCISCKYYRLGFMERLVNLHKFGKCAHPKVSTKDYEDFLVTGKVYDNHMFCSMARADDPWSKCGPDGKYWTPK